MTYTIPSSNPRIEALNIADNVGESLVFHELVAWLPSATLNDFLSDFACHLEAGDYNDLID